MKKNILVSSDAHLYKTPSGDYWTPMIYGYNFWERYLNVFEIVYIVARTKEVKTVPQNMLKVNGDRVKVNPIPMFKSLKELVLNYRKIKKIFCGMNNYDVIIFRAPSITGFLAYNYLKKENKILGCEIVYDPFNDLKNSKKVLKKIEAYFYDYQLKKMCQKCNGVSYVTKNSIQKNYPLKINLLKNKEEYFETSYSSINLEREDYGVPKKFNKKGKIILVHSDASMNSWRKGQIKVIKILKRLIEKKYDIEVNFIGDGPLKKEYKEQVKKLKLENYVKFRGRLFSKEQVKKILLDSDIYILPTEAEGLPRGILEAMALGLPCVASDVGGISEILQRECISKNNSIDEYEDILEKLLNNRSYMNKISRRNIEVASNYKNEILQKKRDEFFRKLSNLKK